MPWLFIDKFFYTYTYTYILMSVKHNKYVLNTDNQTDAILVKK